MPFTTNIMSISLLVLATTSCSNPSSNAMIGKWVMNCTDHPTMSSKQIADIKSINTIDLTVDADSLFFRSFRGEKSLSNWRYGYKILGHTGSDYQLEAAIKGEIIQGISINANQPNQLVFSDSWYHDQLIPPHFKGCNFTR